MDVSSSYPADHRFLNRLWLRLRKRVAQTVLTSLALIRLHLQQTSGGKGVTGRSRLTEWMAIWVVILLAAYLLAYHEGNA